MPIIKPTQRHKTQKKLRTYKNKTLDKQNKNNIAGKKQYKCTGVKPLYPEKTQISLF
jgi:hypothetical protein